MDNERHKIDITGIPGKEKILIDGKPLEGVRSLHLNMSPNSYRVLTIDVESAGVKVDLDAVKVFKRDKLPALTFISKLADLPLHDNEPNGQDCGCKVCLWITEAKRIKKGGE